MKQKVLYCRCADATYLAIAEVAREHGTSINAVVNRAIAVYLEDHVGCESGAAPLP